MGLLNLFRKKEPNFIFDTNLNLDEFEFEVNELTKEVYTLIKGYHEKQKIVFDSHEKLLFANYNDLFVQDKLRMYKSCMELAAVFYYIFAQRFSVNKIDATIAQLYFTSLFHNFNNFNSTIKNKQFTDLTTFLNNKATYLHAALTQLKGQSQTLYFYDIFVLKPVTKGNPLSIEFSEFDVMKTLCIMDYYPKLIQTISRQAEDLVRDVK